MKRSNFIRKALVFAMAMVFLAAVGAIAAEESLTGTVQKNDSGNIVIMADDGNDYMVEGKDLSDMVGKSVKVVGTLQEKENVKSINVMSMEEVKD